MGKIYIASSLHNWREVHRLRDRFSGLGVELTFDWSRRGADIAADVPHQDVQDVSALAEYARSEVDGVLNSDCLLLVWPCRNGSHFEAGLAFARRIPIVFLLPEPGGRDPHRWTSFHALPEFVKVFSEDEAVATVLEILNGELTPKPYASDHHVMDCYRK